MLAGIRTSPSIQERKNVHASRLSRFGLEGTHARSSKLPGSNNIRRVLRGTALIRTERNKTGHNLAITTHTQVYNGDTTTRTRPHSKVRFQRSYRRYFHLR